MRQSDMREVRDRAHLHKKSEHAQIWRNSSIIMQVLKATWIALIQSQLCVLTFTATLPTSRPTELLASLRATDITVLHSTKTLNTRLSPNSTFQLSRSNFTLSINELPPTDPFFLNLFETRVKFYGYGTPLLNEALWSAITQALQDCIGHITHNPDPNVKMGTQWEIYRSSGALLVLRPGPEMTWRMFSLAMTMLWSFYTEFDPRTLEFDVIDLEVGFMGSGQLLRL